MKLAAIVQARTSSKRLPGKVLKEVAGKPLLNYLLDGLEQCSCLDDIVVATSGDESDDPIANLCQQRKCPCYRGSLSDVAGRFDSVLIEYGFDSFVRVNGDSPLLDHRLVEKAVELFRNGNYDMVTNIMQRTFPPGQSVEVLRSETFRQTYRLMNTTDDLEHVTKFFYRNSEDFKILNFVYDFDCHDVSFAIDTADDLDVFANLVSRMTKPHWEYSLPEILELYRNAIGQAEKFN